MYCEKCKKIYSSDENFCADCGSKLVDELDVYARELLNKDEAAFDKIYDNTKTWVSRYVSMHLANQEDCMDCTQEIYFKLFNKIELFHPENGKFRPWFNTLVKNQVIDFARKNSKEVLVEDEEVFEGIVDPEPIAEIEMDRKESSRLLNEILDTLPEEQKQCITGFYFEGRKRKEIAEILGLSEDTIKSRLRLAKQKIEEKVLELERVQGTRLYGLSPFAFFLFLGANERTKGLNFVLLQGRILKQKAIAEQISKDAGTLNGVEETTIEGTKMSVGEAATTVGKATVATAGKSAFMKTMIAIVATAVIGGGSFLGYTIYQKQHKEPKQETIAVQEIDKELEELLNNIDMEYLEGALLLLPEFTEKSTHNRRERPVYGHCGWSRGRFYYRITTFEGRPWDARDPHKTTFMALKHAIRLSIWRKQKETPGVEKAPGVSSPQRKESGRSGRDTGSCGSGCDPAIHARRLRVYHRPRRLRMASRISIILYSRRFSPANLIGAQRSKMRVKMRGHGASSASDFVAMFGSRFVVTTIGLRFL